MNRVYASPTARSKGLILGVVIIVLFVMMSAASSLSKQSGLSERMTGNLSDRTRAFQASETALNEAERWIGSNLAPFEPFSVLPFTEGRRDHVTGFSTDDIDIDEAIADGDVFNVGETNGNPLGSDTPLPGVGKQPAYAVGLTAFTCLNTDKLALFEVHSRGFGRNADTSVLLVSTVKRLLSCGTTGLGSDNDAAI